MLGAFHIPGIEIQAELGHGAYSAVYRAVRGVTPCALKVPRNRGRWTRWAYREAVALARVRHPGLPAVIEVGETPEVPFLLMELVEGQTLADKVREGPMPETEALDLATRLVEALSAVHDAGLVHRDVKPRNIIIERSGRLRLVDFGFAAPAETIALHDAAGTPGYTAPEQFHSPSRVDARADLYAVGQVLLECLTGRAPRALGSGEHAPGGDLRLSAPVTTLLAGLRARDPDDRYPDARSLLCDLAQLRAGRAVLGARSYEPTPGHLPVLIGREGDLARFRRAWDAAPTAGGSTLVVEGPRGAGKTRLLRAFGTVARESSSGRVLEAQCRDHDPPLAALRRVLEAYLAGIGRASGGDRRADEAALREAAGDHLAGFATLIAPKLASVLGSRSAVADAAPGGFPEGAAELLLRLARAKGRLLVCIDDVHWIDPISRQVLLRLAHRAAGAPLVLALGSRLRPSEPRALDELDRESTGRIELGPLDERQVAALVASHLGETDVKGELARRIGALADGTPLGVLEVLGAMLDLGAVRPQEGTWVLDAARMDTVALPDASYALLGRRVAELGASTRRVLQVAALVGSTFDDALVGRVCGLDEAEVERALADASRAGILESGTRPAPRFVHDTAREMVADTLDASERRALHVLIAEALEQGDADVDALCVAARHYAAGDLASTAPRAHRAALVAADAAIGRFDNETALGFLDLARHTADLAGIPLGATFHQSVGEARLRLGALDESLTAFEAALREVPGEAERASIFGRIAWVQQARGDPEKAWEALDRAFAALGTPMPVEGARSLGRTLRDVGASYLRRSPGDDVPLAPADRRAKELLSELHYQNARLGLEYGKTYRLVASAVEARRIGAGLGRSKVRARSRVPYAFVLRGLGFDGRGAAELAAAERMAAELGDPIVIARCAQARGITAAFSGDTETALAAMRECLETHGAWLELNEYCLDAATGEILESMRGKSLEAWSWIERAVERQRRTYRPTAAFTQFLIHRVRACLAALGRRAERGTWLAEQLEATSPEAPRGSFFRLASWGPRARVFVESGEIGPAFEALLAEFAAEGHDPRRVHPSVSELYVAVAHARVHDVLRSGAVDEARLARVEAALVDLRASRRRRGQTAHTLFVEGFVALFRGRSADARRLLGDAEVAAEAEDCPWVLYSIARTRAHHLRREGRAGAAKDQARIAEMLAREHGAEPRARWVREEFGLLSSTPAERESSRASAERAPNASVRQLAGLLRLLHAPDLRPEQQATAIVDDLLRDLDADRGLLSFRPDASAGARLLLGRTRRGDDWSDVEGWRVEWLESVREAGRAWPPDDHASSRVLGQPVDSRRLLAVPLILGEKAVGAIALERAAAAPPFTTEERELLFVMARQMPVSLEIAQLFVERDQLHVSLRQAQKMEAVGQLAGGVAHDFANMLQAIMASLDAIRQRAALDDEIQAETDTISSVTERAGRLMRQLLGFSRQPGESQVLSVNDLIAELYPMLKRLGGERARVVLKLDPEASAVRVGRSSFDQALVNLVVNARDAMPAGGTVTIATRDERIGEDVARRGAASPGLHVRVDVTDTGEGISPEHVHQVFDPFFTTKPAGGGTGIGLTTVYAFVRNAGGHVEVASAVGQGTTFSLFFPAVDSAAAKKPSGASAPSDPPLASSA